MLTKPHSCSLMPDAVEQVRRHLFRDALVVHDQTAHDGEANMCGWLESALFATDPARLEQLQRTILNGRGGNRPIEELRRTAIPLSARIGLKAVADEGREAWEARLAGARERLAAHKVTQRALWDQEAKARRYLVDKLKAGKLGSYRWRHDTGRADQTLPSQFWQSDRAVDAVHGERLSEPPDGVTETSAYQFTAVVRSSELAALYGLAPIDNERPFGAPVFETLQRWVADSKTGPAARAWAQQSGKEWRKRKDVVEAMHGLLQLLPEKGQGATSSIDKALRGIDIQPPLEKPEKLPVADRKKSLKNRK